MEGMRKQPRWKLQPTVDLHRVTLSLAEGMDDLKLALEYDLGSPPSHLLQLFIRTSSQLLKPSSHQHVLQMSPARIELGLSHIDATDRSRSRDLWSRP